MKEENELRILVIGNGFDIQHKLPTRYSDFIRYCESIRKVNVYYKNGMGRKTYSEADNELYEELKQNDNALLAEFVSLLENYWINIFTHSEKNIGDKWLNFESEIERIVKDIISHRERLTNREKAEDILEIDTSSKYHAKGCRTYAEFLNHLYEELGRFDRALEIYLDVHVNKMINEKWKMPVISNIKPEYIISFNYTDTYSKLYGAGEGIYIHGQANACRKAEACNIVLGFDDHYMEFAQAILEAVPFEKYYQRIVKRTTSNLYKLLGETNENGQPRKKHIYFYGHSLSPADGDILKDIISSKNTNVTIYYREGHEEERASMIQNLAVVLSPKELIKNVGESGPIEFVSLGKEELRYPAAEE